MVECVKAAVQRMLGQMSPALYRLGMLVKRDPQSYVMWVEIAGQYRPWGQCRAQPRLAEVVMV